MNTYKLTIPGTYPGMNKFIAAMNNNRYQGNSIKQDSQQSIQYWILNQLKGVTIKGRIKIHYTYFEANKRRDLDNVSGFFHKVFQDALVACEVIHNDGWKQIAGFSDEFFVDSDNPRIEVTIEEVE